MNNRTSLNIILNAEHLLPLHPIGVNWKTVDVWCLLRLRRRLQSHTRIKQEMEARRTGVGNENRFAGNSITHFNKN